MFAFIRSLAGPVLKQVIKMAGNSVGMEVFPFGDFLFDLWEGDLKQKSEAQIQQQIQEVAQGQRALNEKLAVLVDQLAPNQPDAIKQQVVTYLNMVPAAIRRSLRRPDDLSGRSVPKNLRIRGPADLKPFLPDRMPRFKIGDRPLAGTDLVLEEFIGMGGFGEVWKATHQKRPHASPVALKFCTDVGAAKSLHREVELLDRVVANKGRLKNIVELKYAHLQADAPCLEYEYIGDGDLADLLCELRQQNRATPNMIAQIMFQLASAVGSAHDIQPPIIHRDLKPANVLVQRTGSEFSLKVADFGIGNIAFDLAEHGSHAPANTTTTQSYTPLYASPQQRMGRPADPRDDVYSLGVIWYQLLSGDLNSEAPRGGTWKRRLAANGMSADLIALLEQCVEDHAEDRPRSAVVVAKQLREWLDIHESQSYLDSARAELEKFRASGDGDYEKAIADCSSVIRLNPKCADAYRLRAEVFMAGEDYDQAIADHNEIVRQNPNDDNAYLDRARVRMSAGGIFTDSEDVVAKNPDYDSVLADCSIAIKLNPSNAKAYQIRKEVFEEQNDHEKLLAHYTEMVRLDPTNPDAYTDRADFYASQQEDYGRAIADCTEAIRLQPTAASGYLLRAAIYEEMGEDGNAMADSEFAAKLK